MLAEELAPIKAVHDDDLADFLRNLGVLERFEAGEITCLFCGDTVSEANLLALFPFDGKVSFACDKLSCQSALSDANVN